MDAAATYAGSFFILSDSETVQDFLELLCVLGQYLLFDLVAVEEQAVQIRFCSRYGVFQAIYKQIIHRYAECVCYGYQALKAQTFRSILKAINVFSCQISNLSKFFLRYSLLGSNDSDSVTKFLVIYGHVFLLPSARISTDISISEFRT